MLCSDTGVVTIEVDSSGNASAASAARGGWVCWHLTSTSTNSYSIDPPASIFKGNPGCGTLTAGNSIGPYQVKDNAGLGQHTYTINLGACDGAYKGPETGPQMITIE